MPGVHKCYYVDCQRNNRNSCGLHFFKFPVTDKSRCYDWLVNCGRDDLFYLSDNRLHGRRICGRHFKREDFTNSLYNRLNKSAVPIPYFKHDNASQIESSRTSQTSSAQELVHKCPRCGKTFAKREYLFRHLKTNCEFKPEVADCKPEVVECKPDLLQGQATSSGILAAGGIPELGSNVKPSSAFPATQNEEIKTVIKEEIDVDEDDDASSHSAAYSRNEDEMDFEDSVKVEPLKDPLGNKQYDTECLDVNAHQRTLSYGQVSSVHSASSTPSTCLSVSDAHEVIEFPISSDNQKILCDDICNLTDIDPKKAIRTYKSKKELVSELKVEYSELELKLRIDYIKTKIKNEEEISNLKKEVKRLQVLKEKQEIENNREAHLQRMENLRLEHVLLKSLLEKKT